ncbi:MAG: hypothetical protein J5806_03930 [Lentisphaeria bacterium]|nr:hypothetical protein [Lentisphaeria bacterium]
MRSSDISFRHLLGAVKTFFIKYELWFAALILTLMICTLVRHQFQIDKTVSIPVTVATRAGEIPLGTPSPEKITVKLRGRKSILENLSGNDLKIALSTERSEKPSGPGNSGENGLDFRWNVSRNDVQIPLRLRLGVRVVSLEQHQVSMLIDTTESRELPVEAVLDETSLPPGCKVGKVTVNPEKIRITAPSTKLEKIELIRTLPISLEGVRHSFDCDQKLDFSGFSGQDKPDVDREKVFVQVEILRATEETREFTAVPVRILIPPTPKEQVMSCQIVTAPTVDLKVSGEKNLIEILRKEDFFVFADITDFTKPGRYEIDLRCTIGKNGITKFEINPQRISVKLERVSK